jgi:hypothetical protein
MQGGVRGRGVVERVGIHLEWEGCRGRGVGEVGRVGFGL